MKDLTIVVYTMKGCPYCEQFKELLKNESIEFFDRDIDDYKEEYDLFTEITSNDMIPAMLIVEGDEKNYESFLYVPDKDYTQLTEAMDIVRNHLSKTNII